MASDFLRTSAKTIRATLRELLFLLLLSSCQRPLTATLQPQSLKANSLEEIVDRKDEILLAYALSAFDEKNQLVGTQNGAFGVESMKKGQVIGTDRFVPVSLSVPPRGRLVATVALIEVEDYSRAQQFVDRIRKVTGLAGGAATLLQATELTSPLGYLVLSLQAAGIALQNTKYFDSDDVLGSHTFTLSGAQLRKPARFRIPKRFQGTARLSRYDYELTYEVTLRRQP